MENQKLRKAVRNLIFQVLKEQSEITPDTDKKKPAKPEAKPAKPEAKPEKPAEKPKKKKKAAIPGTIAIASGAVGKGRFKKFVGEAGARAKKDPKNLMKDLGVKAASGADLDQILSIFNSAFYANNTMGSAYAGARSVNEKGKKGVGVTLRKIDSRNGIKFLAHTLEGAKNAGFLKLKAGAEIGKGESADIIIYSI